MATVTWDGSESTAYSTAGNWDTGSVPDDGDDVVIPDTSGGSINACNVDSNDSCNSLTISTNGEIGSNNGSKLFILGEASTGNAVNNDGIITDNGGTSLDLDIRTEATTALDLNGSSGNFRNVTINHASCNALMSAPATIIGNLTISAGTLDTTSGDHALTVTGTITVNSTSNTANLNINDSAVSCAKIAVESADTITASHSINALTVNGVGIGTGRSIDFTGVISGTLDIICTHPNTIEADLSASSGVINHLTLNHASLVMKMNSPATLGNLTITSGTFNTEDSGGNDKDLTVTGNTKVTGTLTGNNSTLIFGTDGVYSTVEAGGLWVEAAGSLTFGSGDLTAFSGFTAKGSEASPNVTSTGGGDIIIKGRTNNGFMNSHSHQGVNITGDYIIDYDNNSIFDNRGGTTIACGTFIIKHDGRTYEPWNNSGQDTFKIIGNMEIQDGTFDTEYSGQSSQPLTITGDCVVTGTLTLNGSTVAVGALRAISGAAITQDSDGTLEITTGSNFGGASNYSFRNDDATSDINLGGTLTITAGTYFYPRTAPDNASVINNLVWNGGGYWVGNLTIGGTLVVNASKEMNPYGGSKDIVVTGAVTLNGKLSAYPNNHSDLDTMTFGSLTINSGGTYQATTGTTILNGNFTDAGTFTHNNGTVSTPAGTAILLLGTSNTAFYDIKSASTGSGVSTFKQYTNKTVEHDMITGSKELQWQLNTNDVVLTLGTDSYASQIDADYFDGTVVANQYVQGASELYPAVFKSTIQYLRFTGHTGQGGYMPTNAHIKYVDIQKDITTPGDTKTLTLDGDCKFAAVTVSGGDTLDLNEKRVNFGGYNQVVNDGTIDATNALMYLGYFGGTGTFTNDANTKVVYQNCDGSRGSWRFAQNTSGVSMLNDSRNHDLAHDTTIGKLILGDTSATGFGLSSGGNEKDLTVTDLTITTGATLVDDGLATGSVITCSGDFTMSGGLIGNSALVYDGTNDVSYIQDMSQISGLALMTVEAWAKYDDDTSGYSYICRKEGEYQLGINSSGKFYGFIVEDGGTERNVIGTDDLRDGKWHHFAMVWDGSKAIGYLDGKKVGETSGGTAAVNNSSNVLSVGCRDADGTCSSFMKGTIGLIQIWNDVRTQTEIRGGMFTKYDNTEGGLAGSWQMDYYSSTQVDDVEENGRLTFGAATGGTGGAGANPCSYVGGGTFTHGTSTLDMTDDGTIGIAGGVTQFNNLTVAASGKTTTLAVLAGSSDIRFHGTLTHGGGTASSSGNPAWTMKGTSTVSAGSNWTGWYLCYWDSSAVVPASSWKYWIAIGDNISLAGDMTCTGYFRPHQKVVSSGDYTITTYNALFHDSGGLNMGAGSLIFTHAQGLSDTTSSSVFTAGPGATVTGVAGKSTFMSQNNFTVVGNVTNLNVTNEELSVTGKVTNCTGEIHQQFPTVDHDQQLDFDTADDRDIHLGRDIDKNTELINS